MQRDLDFARDLLLQLEDSKTDDPLVDLDAHGRPDLELRHHLRILADEELIEVHEFGDGEVIAKRLTWKGHELLDALKSDDAWDHAKAYVRKNAGTWTFQLILTALNAFLTGRLHL